MANEIITVTIGEEAPVQAQADAQGHAVIRIPTTGRPVGALQVGVTARRATRAATPAAPAASSVLSRVLWQDTFDRADGPVGNGWVAVDGAVGVIEGNSLRRTDTFAFRRLEHAAGGLLPADYYLETIVPHATISTDFWGIAGRVVAGTGVMFLRFSGSLLMKAGALTAGGWGDITMTGGLPASWAVDQDHRVGLSFVGDRVALVLDGQEYGFLTTALNRAGGTGVSFPGDGQGGQYVSRSITVRDSLT